VGRIGSGVRVSASFPKNARVVRYNKCIEDDTKAAAHQSPNCISKNQKNKIWRKTIFNGGCNYYTLQCGMWFWDDMPWNSPKRPPHSNSTSGLDFDHRRSRHVILHQSAIFFIQIGPLSADKNDVMSVFKMADLSRLGFYGSNNGFFEKPLYDFL